MKVRGILKIIRRMHSVVRTLLLAFVSVGILFFVFFVSTKNAVFERTLNRVSVKFAERGYRFHWNDSRVNGLNRISVARITVTSMDDSTSVELDSLAMQFGLLRSLRGKMQIGDFSCRHISIRLAGYEPMADIDTLAVEENTRTYRSPGYAAWLNRIVHRLFLAIPRKLDIDTVRISFRAADSELLFTFLDSRIRAGMFSSSLYTSEVADSSKVFLKGRIDRKEPAVSLLAHNPAQNKCMLYFPGEHTVRAGFDTLLLSFAFPRYSNKLVSIEGTSLSKNFVLEGESLSSLPINIRRMHSSFRIIAEPHSMKLDSSTTFTINDISFHPYICIKREPDLVTDIKICSVSWDAHEFFRSLPEGMFTSLAGFDAAGRLKFFLDFSVNLSSVDSLKFSSRLTADDFRIKQYGKDDFRIMNTEFTHEFFEKGRLTASFTVGPSNPDFTSLAEISPWLKISVLTSEDGGFYYHRGFNPGAIRESLITNIKERRFVRGGSTISMQLVKNIFLTRHKTIGRKLEELLIVWIIENNRLVSKERMFEIYLNVIEWGPGIFGIQQASRYYFNKTPAELGLQESLFLAGIVPFPKRFKSVFEDNGCPKSYFSAYMQRMKALMVAREYIQSMDTTGVDQNVFLTGPASQVFVVRDTIVIHE